MLSNLKTRLCALLRCASVVEETRLCLNWRTNAREPKTQNFPGPLSCIVFFLISNTTQLSTTSLIEQHHPTIRCRQ